jgi:hypothetical protein
MAIVNDAAELLKHVQGRGDSVPVGRGAAAGGGHWWTPSKLHEPDGFAIVSEKVDNHSSAIEYLLRRCALVKSHRLYLFISNLEVPHFGCAFMRRREAAGSSVDEPE